MNHAEKGITPPLTCWTSQSRRSMPAPSWPRPFLTPGRPRSYVITLASARTSATRAARTAKFRSRIMDGKGDGAVNGSVQLRRTVRSYRRALAS